MAKELLRLEDYQSVQILGLEPKDRQPHDYLRLVAKIFNSFRNIDPEVTVSSYLSGFVTNIIDIGDAFKFMIEKGTCYIDDQFIGFTEDVSFTKEKSFFINNLDYFLVLKYQYSTQYPGPVPIFDFTTENGFDSSHMLKILKFKVEGTGLLTKAIAYPQNLDNLYMENFPRLFELLENKVVNSLEIMKYQFYKIKLEELYVNTQEPQRSCKSGDVVYLDTVDKTYKPARACNKRLDKALGIYLYNPTNNDHIIVTSGLIDFSKEFELDSSNITLENLEAGRSYYLLDGCTETNYEYENAYGKEVAGKISTRFFPGTVIVGYAIDNTNFMIDFNYSAEMNVKNILEIIGLPEEYADRFEIFFNYYIAVESKERLTELEAILQIRKGTLIEDLDAKITEVQDREAKTVLDLGIYNNTNLVPTVTDTDLKLYFDNFFDSLSTSRGESILSDSIINKGILFVPAFKAMINECITELQTIVTSLNGVSSITVPASYYFTNEIDLPSIIAGIPNQRSSTGTLEEYPLQTIRDWAIADLIPIKRAKMRTHVIAERPQFYADANDSTITATTIAHRAQPSTYNTVVDRVAKAGHASLAQVNISRSVVDYDPMDTLEWGNNVVQTYKTNTDILITSINNIIGIFTNILPKLDSVLEEINNLDATALRSSSSVDTEYSFINYIDSMKKFLFDRGYNDASNLPDQISALVGQAELIDRAGLYSTNNKNSHMTSLFKISDNVYRVDYCAKQFQHIIQENIIPYIEQLSSQSTHTSTMDTAITKINTYITERNTFESTKYDKYQIFTASKLLEDKATLERIQLQAEVDKALSDLSIINNITLPSFETQVQELDSTLLSRIKEESSIHEIFYLSNYERKIYNYTYITLRLRLKYKNKKVIENNIQIISDKLFLLKNEPIPDYELIIKLEGTQLAYQSILNTLNEEMKSMIAEYNDIRINQFGIAPIEEGDEDFDDGGFANPDLDCFASTM